jgi:hypothetical protein
VTREKEVGSAVETRDEVVTVERAGAGVVRVEGARDEVVTVERTGAWVVRVKGAREEAVSVEGAEAVEVDSALEGAGAGAAEVGAPSGAPPRLRVSKRRCVVPNNKREMTRMPGWGSTWYEPETCIKNGQGHK